MTEYRKETTETYWDMMEKTEFEHDWDHGICESDSVCMKCSSHRTMEPCLIPDPIPLSPPELAEYMRVQCLKQIIMFSWHYYLKLVSGYNKDYDMITRSTPEQRIEAAVKAWEAKK